MAEKSYVAGIHFIVKALDGLRFPVDKEDLVARYGDKVVRVGRTDERTIKELVEPIPADRFETAASLHNGIMALLPCLPQGC